MKAGWGSLRAVGENGQIGNAANIKNQAGFA